MITITYAPPELEESEVWEVAEDSWTIAEMKLIEKYFGGVRKEFFAAVAQGSDTARAILLWVVRRRSEPELTLGDLDELKVPYLLFAQHFDDAEPDAVNDPKGTPNESEPAATSSSTE